MHRQVGEVAIAAVAAANGKWDSVNGGGGDGRVAVTLTMVVFCKCNLDVIISHHRRRHDQFRM